MHRLFDWVSSLGMASELMVTREYLEQLRKEVTWEVETYENNIFKGWTMDDFKETFEHNNDMIDELMSQTETVADDTEVLDISDNPKEFDGRKKWLKCIHEIRTQGKCGSCWAFSLTEAISDRFCINGRDVVLSPQHLVACCRGSGFSGCNGGSSPLAMNFLIKQGVVTEKCYPYTLKNTNITPHCPEKCTGSGDWKKRYHCQANSGVIIRGNREKVKAEIVKNGPMGTFFEYRRSFNSYIGGIYTCTDPYIRIGHFMKIIGWGVSSGINYWIIANSFGTAWGEKGYVKFKMGVCGIDELIYACQPDLKRLNTDQ